MQTKIAAINSVAQDKISTVSNTTKTKLAQLNIKYNINDTVSSVFCVIAICILVAFYIMFVSSDIHRLVTGTKPMDRIRRKLKDYLKKSKNKKSRKTKKISSKQSYRKNSLYKYRIFIERVREIHRNKVEPITPEPVDKKIQIQMKKKSILQKLNNYQK